MDGPVKTAFAKIRPAIDPGLHTKPASRTPNSNGHARGGGAQKPAVHSPPPLPPGKPLTLEVQLWTETITDPTKNCPCFVYVSPPLADPPIRLSVVFNLSVWPASGAVARADQNAIKWMAGLALMDRVLTWPGHPVLRTIGDHLARLAGCPQEFKRGLWSAYSLKDCEILARVPDLVLNASAPQKFAQFEVVVDSNRLEDFRGRMAKRYQAHL